MDIKFGSENLELIKFTKQEAIISFSRYLFGETFSGFSEISIVLENKQRDVEHIARVYRINLSYLYI